MKQRAIEYFFKHGIDSELSNEYFRHTGIDLLNIQNLIRSTIYPMRH
jgi:hypothetical protein